MLSKIKRIFKAIFFRKKTIEQVKTYQESNLEYLQNLMLFTNTKENAQVEKK